MVWSPHARLAHARPRQWPAVVIGIAAAVWGWTVHPGLGVALTVFGIGIAFDFPDAEDEYAAHVAQDRERTEAARRRARAATPLDPEGEIEVDGARRRARMVDGTAAAGEELEVVNEIRGMLIVQHRR